MDETPNFDEMDVDDLSALAREAKKNPLAFARKLFPSRPHNFTKAARLIGDYVLHKAAAVDLRKDGYITDAVRHERSCDILYNQLPKFAKW